MPWITKMAMKDRMGLKPMRWKPVPAGSWGVEMQHAVARRGMGRSSLNMLGLSLNAAVQVQQGTHAVRQVVAA